MAEGRSSIPVGEAIAGPLWRPWQAQSDVMPGDLSDRR